MLSLFATWRVSRLTPDDFFVRDLKVVYVGCRSFFGDIAVYSGVSIIGVMSGQLRRNVRAVFSAS
jgi:hypothetical protein